MATKRVYVTGTANWAKLFKRNRDMGDFHEATDGITSIDVVLDQEEMATLKASGSRLSPKITDEGISVKFRRPWRHTSIEEFGGQPQVVDKDGNPWDDGVSIGNGSKVEVAADVYDTVKGKGTRLAGVKVLELVEFDSEAPDRPF